MRVINSAPLLDENWLCPEIVDRKEQRELLQRYIIDNLMKGVNPPNIYIHGVSGSGKTFLVRRLLEMNANDIKLSLPKFEYIYISSKMLQPPSITSLMYEINKRLRHYLPVDIGGKVINDIKLWKDNTQSLVFKAILEKGICLLLVIDEVDKIVYTEDSFRVMNFFIDMQNVSTIFISNRKDLGKKMPHEVSSRLVTINFSLYTTTDLYEILKVTAKYALDGVDDDVLLMIANEIGSSTTSARDAKHLLYHYIMNGGNLEYALRQLDVSGFAEDVANLNIHQQIVLLAISKIKKHIENCFKNGIPLSITTHKHSYITSKSVYDLYCKLCRDKNVSPRSYRTFTNMLDSLREIGFINYTKIHKGKGKGTVGAIEIEDEDLFDEVILFVKSFDKF